MKRTLLKTVIVAGAALLLPSTFIMGGNDAAEAKAPSACIKAINAADAALDDWYDFEDAHSAFKEGIVESTEMTNTWDGLVNNITIDADNLSNNLDPIFDAYDIDIAEYEKQAKACRASKNV